MISLEIKSYLHHSTLEESWQVMQLQIRNYTSFL